MNCPNCGNPEKTRAKICTSCDSIYVNEDLEQYQKLEYLVKETSDWKVAKKIRKPYLDKLQKLKEKLLPSPAVPEPVLAPVTISKSIKIANATDQPIMKSNIKPISKEKPIPKPPKEKIPFDQWLLSERNIKFMLYSGAALLIVAGLVWIGVRWNNFPGFVKFAITFFITGLSYLGGFLIYQRPRLRFGGNAILGIASGFLVMNFIVLQIYVFGPEGLNPIIMWLIASPICMGIYLTTAYFTKSKFFVYLSIAALASILLATLILVKADLLIYLFSFNLLLLGLLWGSFIVEKTNWEKISTRPLKWTSHLGMPIILFVSVVTLLFYPSIQLESNNLGFFNNIGSPWIAILALSIGVTFYSYQDFRGKSIIARWATSILFTITLGLLMSVLDFTNSQAGTTLIIQSFAFLGIGKWFSGRDSRKFSGWAFYLVAYFISATLTIYSLNDINQLIKILIADVFILAVAANIHLIYRKELFFLSVWLFMLPIYLLIDQANDVFHTEGLLMGVLGINYAAIGYILGRKNLKNGMPFLSASAFLSIATLFMTWGDPTSATIVLVFDAILYLIAATWIGFPWLLLPSLAALSMAIIHITTATPAFIISMAVLGNAVALGGYILKRIKLGKWSWPLYLVGAIDILLAYVLSFIYGDTFLIVGLSAELVILLFLMALLEKDFFQEKKYQHVLAYSGIFVLFVGHFFVLDLIFKDTLWRNWPPYTAALTAFFALVSWILPKNTLGKIFKTPFSISGLGLMVIAVVGSLFTGQETIIAVTFIIATLIYIIEAGRKASKIFAYIGIAGIFITHFFILSSLLGYSIFLRVWPIYTLILTSLFVFLYRIFDRYKIGKVFVMPLKQAGLSLILLPTIFSLINFNQSVLVGTLIITSLIYLSEANRSQINLFSYGGLLFLYAVPYFIFEVILGFNRNYGFQEEGLVIIYSLMPLLFIFIHRALERYKIGKIFIAPLKQFGSVLIILPILYSILFFIFGMEIWLVIFAFAITMIIYMTEALKTNNLFFAYLGLTSIYIIHAAILLDNRIFQEIWPIITILFTTIMSIIYWVLDRYNTENIFKIPLRNFGLGLLIVPILGSILNENILQLTILISIATGIYLIEAIRKNKPLFSFLSTSGVYIIHILLIMLLFPNSYTRIWPPVSAAFSALLSVVYWQLYIRKRGTVFQVPYRIVGLGLMAVPLLFSLINFDKWNSVIAWAIASVVYLIEARIKRKLILSYFAIGIVNITLWLILFTLNINELQAYVFPLGITMIGAGWYQRKNVADQFYQPITIVGLGIFFISAFYQSIPTDAWGYALLLTAESIFAIIWGIRQKSRGYVQFGGLALITNAINQLGPAFATLDRWIQMGSIGSILLIFGLFALFKREEVLETRQKITKEWRSWNS